MAEIIIPMITPFRDGQLDAATLRDFVSYAKDNRFDGLFPGGSTGGFASLSHEQHRTLLSEVIEESTGMNLFAGICRNSVDDTVEMGKAALDMGYHNLVCINPFYHKYSERSVENFFDMVFSSLDADMYIYNNPSLSGFRLSPDLVSRLRERHPNLVGMKDSGNDFQLFREFLKIEGLKVYQGKDAMLLESLSEGAHGGVCSTANFSLNTSLIAHGNGDLRAISGKTGELVNLVSRYEVPAIHNYLFRRLIMGEEEPHSYMNPPFTDLQSVPDLAKFRENSILP